ncbi:MAG TPA: FAD-dependent oxidoreductase [bacterium]
MAGKRHVIVGAGTAGYNAIRTLRQMGSTDEITLVSAERPYSRMVLPYFLEQGISEAHTQTISPNQLEKLNVTTHFGRRAVALDTAKHTLKLDNDDEVPYDDLLIATGSSAVKLPLPGCDGERVYSFWTLADAKGLSAHIDPKTHVAMVGAGFIAFTILNGILQRAGKVTIVEVADRILPRMVDDTGAKLVSDWLEARGVTLRTGARLKEIADKGGKKALAFEAGKAVQADVVVMATGIRTNLDWLKGSGVKIEQGIVVDDHLRSSVPDIYAAGDVAQAKNRITGASEVHAIEPTAMEHGRVVGANMAGKDVAYPGSLLMNIVGVAGLDIASFGSWDAEDAEPIDAVRPERSSYRKYLFRGDRLIGAIYVGPDEETWAGNELGMLKGLVQSGQPLGPWKDYLKRQPFDIRKPYLAAHTVSALLPGTVLGQPTPSPRV